MFLCPNCRQSFALPRCGNCGYEASLANNVWWLTDAPDIETDDDGDKYIGYENIGENYLCRKTLKLTDSEYEIPKALSEITGEGTMLDLGCGDGAFTVPTASFGTRIIAGDISVKMLSLLQRLAEANRISLANVTLVRMNALDIPLSDNSVDTVIANSMLHLISNPEKVLSEIHRVLTKGGVFVCLDDAPTNNSNLSEEEFDNSKIAEIINFIYTRYWEMMKQNGIGPKKYSWRFDRDSACARLFASRTLRILEGERKYLEYTLDDCILTRLRGRGYSDQVDVPQGMHESVFPLVMEEAERKYGDQLGDVKMRGYFGSTVQMTLYLK